MRSKKRILALVVALVVAINTIPAVALAMPAGSTHSLTTTFAAGNRLAGNMFDVDVTSLSYVEIDSFDIHLWQPGVNAVISVYFRSGSYVGAESSPEGWTLAGTRTVTSLGTGNPTPLNIGNILLHPGQKYGFYITVTDYATRMEYTNGYSTYSDDNLKITSGIGKATPDFAYGANQGRIWNGTIYYHIVPSITASAGTGGSISPSGTMLAATGSSLTYTITPNTGYRIVSVLVDGADQGPISSYTFNNVQASHTIAASFEADAPIPPVENNGNTGPTYINRTLTNSSGITVSGPEIHRSAGLSVRSLDEASIPTALREAVAGGRIILGYDVSLSRGFRGAVDLSFPVGSAYEGQLVTILHYVNGSVETYTAVVTNGMAIITVNSLSPFVVLTTGVIVPADEVMDPPKTGNAGNVQSLIMIMGALGGLVLVRRRKVLR